MYWVLCAPHYGLQRQFSGNVCRGFRACEVTCRTCAGGDERVRLRKTWLLLNRLILIGDVVPACLRCDFLG